MNTSSSDIANAWSSFDIAKTLLNEKHEDGGGLTDSQNVVVKTFEIEAIEAAEDQYNAADYLIGLSVPNSVHFPNNCSVSQIRGNGVTPRMLLYHRICSIDTREYHLYEESQAFRSRLVQSNVYTIGAIDDCVNTFIHMCKKLYRKGSRKAHRSVAVGSAYFTLKLTMSPTLVEIAKVFDLPRHFVLKSIKAFRMMCVGENDMQWIFANESGKTNLFRFVNIMGLGWSSVHEIEDDMTRRGEDKCNNIHIVQSIWRYMVKNNILPVQKHDLKRYIGTMCGSR